MAEIDHIVVGARTLEAGAAYIEAHLGVRPGPGGRHEGVGTHNMLLGLGPSCYLEVIAPDPDQPDPPHPRPFDLDDPGVKLMLEAEPRLVAWVARTPVLDAVVTRLGTHHAGEIRAMKRGKLSWRLAMPPQNQDMSNLIPALIQWDDHRPRLPDSGVRLVALEAEHPEVDALRNALAQRGLEEALRLRRSPQARLVARFTRPDGREAVLASR
ncbi:VOC family protein [Falsiroseomonas oryzae]|uniref:VOC family protein n=1 Tax=Falsiroseomonas oryzae TaxID=2766473 RepID=UPI0022EAD75E|nr:VOC family protein [Roseomonas sp. MO-31]